MTDRLQQQIAFLLEIDKLKQIIRQTYLLDGTRKENDAEHSWHFAMFAFILAEYAPEPVDILKVIKMALVHDLVEIDAGDTFLYDEAGNANKAEREAKAADRIFALLPAEQGAEIRALWEEFEAKKDTRSKIRGRAGPIPTLSAQLQHPGTRLARARDHSRPRLAKQQPHLNRRAHSMEPRTRIG